MADYKGDNILEKLGAFIPGYAGYVQREGRRKTDKMLRERLARLLDEQQSLLDAAARMLLAAKALHLVIRIDELKRKLDTTASQIRFAPYGSSGFFDLVQVKEPELDRLYACDISLKEACEAFPAILSKLNSPDTVELICKEACEHLTLIRECIARRRILMQEM